MIRDILRPDYRAHAVLVDPARAKSELWRLCAGLVLAVLLLLFIAQFFVSIYIEVFFGSTQSYLLLEETDRGNSPVSVYFLLLQVALLTPVIAMVAYSLHKRRLNSLIGPTELATTQFVAVLVMLSVLCAVIFALPPYGYEDGEVQSNLGFGKWLVLLPLSIVVVLLQCAAEEIVFRGYIQQQLAARFQHPAIWLIIPSALFGLLHYDPEAGSNAAAIAVWAAIFGFFMADITARAGTLGPAIAIHLVNNFIALLLLAPADEMNGLALYTMPFGLDDEDAVRTWLMIDLFYMCVSWLAARLALQR